ncbi:MAG: fumarate hydratase, partial [Synergistaceae bacterium]|nr:fumarate hydratase [Synergistaceae bacterium]
NGLPSTDQLTTARDMLTLAKNYIENHPEAMHYHDVQSITYKRKTTTNKNPLLRMYPHLVDGLKTGWTTASRHNLIATARSGDIRLISVVLGAPTSSELTYGSAFLIEAGFRTVESGGTLKVSSQLDALVSGTSPDIVPTPGTTVYAVASTDVTAISDDLRPAEISPDISIDISISTDVSEPPVSEDISPEVELELPHDGIPPRLEDELVFEYDIDPGDDIEFDEWEFDDPSVWSGSAGDSWLRVIDTRQIIEAVEALCVEANYMADDISSAKENGIAPEDDEVLHDVLPQLAEDTDIVTESGLPHCRDTGMTVVFVEIGQDVRISGGSVRDAVNEGVRRGYKDGYLRASVVADPIDRVNSGDNTPAVIYFDIVPGDKVRIVVSPNGFGSENMSRVGMLTPADGIAGIKKFVIETIEAAGPNPCPPIMVGVGVGGTLDYAALMAKQALLRPVGSANGSWLWDGLERELLDEINSQGIINTLAVHIRTYPTHIAGLPIAVSIGCHYMRHVEMTL